MLIKHSTQNKLQLKDILLASQYTILGHAENLLQSYRVLQHAN